MRYSSDPPELIFESEAQWLRWFRLEVESMPQKAISGRTQRMASQKAILIPDVKRASVRVTNAQYLAVNAIDLKVQVYPSGEGHDVYTPSGVFHFDTWAEAENAVKRQVVVLGK